MKNISGIIVAILIVILIIFSIKSHKGNDVSKIKMDDGEGRVVFSITDDTANIEAINDVVMNIRGIEIYNANRGWIVVSDDTKAYPLLALKLNGKVELYGAQAVTADTYNKIKVSFGDIVVDNKDEGRVEAVMPSEEIVFDADVVVESDADSHVTLDFLADQSLHRTEDGQYVFAPVIAVESRSEATIEIKADNEVIVSDGYVDTKKTIGVDLDGSAKEGFHLDVLSGLKVESTLLNDVQFMLGDKIYSKNEHSEENDTEEETDISTEVDLELDL